MAGSLFQTLERTNSDSSPGEAFISIYFDPHSGIDLNVVCCSTLNTVTVLLCWYFVPVICFLSDIIIVWVILKIKNARNRRRLVCCSICGKAFGKCSDLVRHYRIHSGSRPFSCNRCEKSFSLKSSLKLHLENHVREDNIDNYYTSARCPVCMKQVGFVRHAFMGALCNGRLKF